MNRRVLKFGGAALADGPGVARACEIIARAAENPPIVVVSAHQGVTDQLEAAARSAARGEIDARAIRVRHRTILAQLGLDAELCDRHLAELSELLARVHARGALQASELDFALSFGERMSARIVARTLRGMGLPATPVDAYDLGLLTDSNFGGAQPLDGTLASVAAAIRDVPGIVVVTGFLAKDRAGNLTTLGRNGSDLTASILAEAIGASELVFWKSVPGILTADPAIVPLAQPLARITYAEAAELSFHGARILHPAAIAPAVRAQIPVRVCDVHAPDQPGTTLVAERPRLGPVGIATRREVWLLELAIEDPDARAEQHSRLFGALQRAGATPGLIASTGERVSALLEPHGGIERVLAELGAGARLERDLGLAAVVGEQIGSDQRLAERALECLRDARVEVRHAWVGTRLSSQAFLVAARELPRAAHALHEALVGGRLASV